MSKRSPREKAKDLIELALDDGTSDAERATAAFRALKIIRKYDLLSSPLDVLDGSSNKNVKAAKKVLETLGDPELVSSVKALAGLFRRRR